MENQDVRWRQRQQNFNKALSHLEQSLDISEPDIVQRAGIVQFFEMTFELAWKMLKDYLEGQGFVGLNSPRTVLKQAFESGLIVDGHRWLQILRDRNLMTHTYDETTAVTVEALIRETYAPLMQDLHKMMVGLENG